MRMSPRAMKGAARNPSINASRLDLPAPLAPVTVTISPGAMSIDTCRISKRSASAMWMSRRQSAPRVGFEAVMPCHDAARTAASAPPARPHRPAAGGDDDREPDRHRDVRRGEHRRDLGLVHRRREELRPMKMIVPEPCDPPPCRACRRATPGPGCASPPRVGDQGKWQSHSSLRASQIPVGARRSGRNEARCCAATLTPALSRRREREQCPARSPACGRVGGEAGLSSRMRRAGAAVRACKPERALQVRVFQCRNDFVPHEQLLSSTAGPRCGPVSASAALASLLFSVSKSRPGGLAFANDVQPASGVTAHLSLAELDLGLSRRSSAEGRIGSGATRA